MTHHHTDRDTGTGRENISHIHCHTLHYCAGLQFDVVNVLGVLGSFINRSSANNWCSTVVPTHSGCIILLFIKLKVNSFDYRLHLLAEVPVANNRLANLSNRTFFEGSGDFFEIIRKSKI